MWRMLRRVSLPAGAAMAATASLSQHCIVACVPPVSSTGPIELEDAMQLLFGSRSCGSDSLHSILVRKLTVEAGPRTLSMQQRNGLPEHQHKLRHQSFDHCDNLGKCIKLGAHPLRQVMGFTSAETRGFHALAVVPDTSYAAMQPMNKELSTRRGGAAKFTVIDNMRATCRPTKRTWNGTSWAQSVGRTSLMQRGVSSTQWSHQLSPLLLRAVHCWLHVFISLTTIEKPS